MQLRSAEHSDTVLNFKPKLLGESGAWW